MSTSDLSSARSEWAWAEMSPIWTPRHEDEEQRAYPRLPSDYPVALRNSLGQHCAATLRNISPLGLQLACSPVTARIVHARASTTEVGPILLQATVVLTLEDGAHTFSAGVRLVHEAFSAEWGCVMGFQFLELRPRARRLVDAFYAERLRQGIAAESNDAALTADT